MKNEVQCAINADEEATAKLCANYIDNIDNIDASPTASRVKSKSTGLDGEPDDASIEGTGDITESRKAALASFTGRRSAAAS